LKVEGLGSRNYYYKPRSTEMLILKPSSFKRCLKNSSFVVNGLKIYPKELDFLHRFKHISSKTPAIDHADDHHATKLPRKSKITSLAELSKARLSALVVFTTSTGYLAAGGPIEIIPFTAACVGTSLAAASASTFNQVIEIQNDMMMKRTCNRPLPGKQISKEDALKWGILTAGTSTAILAYGTNPLTAALGLGNIFLYSIPYTLSKTKTEANTWIGAVVGAIPPVMGWTAATGSLETVDPILLGALLFYWQFPHFLALSWMYKKDYARGGFKMIPCADPTGERTASLIRRYAAYLASIPLISTAVGSIGSMFALEGVLLNAYCLSLAQKFHDNRTNENAKKVFQASLWYLPCLLSLFVFHSKNWQSQTEDSEETEPFYAFLRRMRTEGRNLCVHEILAHDKEINQPSLCPVVVSEDALEQAKEVSKDINEANSKVI